MRSRLSDGLNTIALHGNSTEINFNDVDISPELTNIGSFKKCWKLIDGYWYMIKKGTYKENFAEVLIANIAINFGILRKDGEPVGLAPNFDNNLGLSGVLNNKGLESTWYSTAFTRNNYKPILKAYNYVVPKIDLKEIQEIINDTLKDFPILRSESGFSEIVFKIIKNNYEELLK